MLVNKIKEVPTEPVNTTQVNLWAIVLAGGQGTRLRALTRYLYGSHWLVRLKLDVCGRWRAHRMIDDAVNTSLLAGTAAGRLRE